MPDIHPCCGADIAAHHPWTCPATPAWKATVEAVQPRDLGIEMWALESIPVRVINQPSIGLTINQNDASWTLTDQVWYA
ncbi:MAG: hypothetical protein AB1925_12650 [Actinomycetota bacterium]